jgi:hypothetical protein
MFKRLALLIPLVVFTGALVALSPLDALAATSPRLGTALNFTVLAGSTVTNTGSSVITGNLGLAPGSSVPGFPPGNVTGAKHVSDEVAIRAKNDLTTAYTDAANAPVTTDMTGLNLGGRNLVAGVYKFRSSAQLTGQLTLSGGGAFIFEIVSTLTTASNSVVSLTNGAQACSVFWQVGSSATLGSATHFQGTLMALTSISMVTGANIISGRAMARDGGVTLDANHITPPVGTCTAGSFGGAGGSGGSGGAGGPGTGGTPGSVPVPETGSGMPNLVVPATLLVIGVMLIEAGRRTRAHATR